MPKTTLTCPQCKHQFEKEELTNPYYPAQKCPECFLQRYVDGSWWPAKVNMFYVHQKKVKQNGWCGLHPHAWINPETKKCTTCQRLLRKNEKKELDIDDFSL